MLLAFGLDVAVWLPKLSKVLSLSAALHDIGKANNHFQKAVHGLAAPDDRQPIRHEWISIWIAVQPEVKKWLMSAIDDCEDCWSIVMFAIAGHHRKGLPEEGNSTDGRGFSTDSILISSNHEDFKKCVDQLRDWFDLGSSFPSVEPILYDGFGDEDRKEAFFDMLYELGEDWERIKQDLDWQKFCAIAKAALIAADVAASALWEKLDKPVDRIEWIKSSLNNTASQTDLDRIVEAQLDGREPFPFQNEVARSTASVTLVEAGCGGGKTAAAYMWAAKQHVGRRIWFCYPTTGTATEGFKEYLFAKLPQESDARVGLFHSRSGYDIKQLLENPRDRDFDFSDSSVRVESLNSWDTQIVSCTVDNVLFLNQNQRRGLYAWPALANSAIVFDEIHCFDDKLFANLLAWLKNMVGIPVLLMTASLPNARRDAIKRICEEQNRSFEHVPSGPPELENVKRYQNCLIGESLEANGCASLVEKELLKNGRVLWISNTVERTRNVGQLFFDCEPIYYHSRFIYKDRAKRHSETVSLFEDAKQEGFASTSQVAEMSLDLAYATLLVTELAPIPAMIQRLGRLNRRANGDSQACDFIVIEPLSDGEFSPLPYDEDELELTREWLKRLGSQPLSQSDLVQHWHDLDNSVEIQPEVCRWLVGGLATPVDAIREASYGITIIRNSDLKAARKEGTAAYALPMNHPQRENWKANNYGFRGFPIASDDAIEYDFKKGAKWATHNQF